MAVIATISSSPSSSSRTDALLSHVVRRLEGAGHEVRPIVLRELPAEALLRADPTDPRVAAAVQDLLDADGVVVTTPVYKAAYTGVLKTFLDLLPQYALAGKAVLPLATGGTPAHVLAVDYALRPVLASLGAEHIGLGWFVLASEITVYPEDGGVLLAPSASTAVYAVTRSFLDHLESQRAAGSVVASVSAVPGDQSEVTVRRVAIDDPALVPLLADLVVEYGTRYGRLTPNTTLSEVPHTDFAEPHGAFIVLERDGRTVAGGAIRRFDDRTAEVKRVWTANDQRRQGLGRRVVAELERVAADLGYQQLHLTTGPRQPEARALYESAGYEPRFDTSADPETIGPLAFAKVLSPAATRAPWQAA